MDILESHIIMETTWWHMVAGVIFFVGVIGALFAMSDGSIPGVIVLACIALVALAVFIFAPAEQPTDRWSTTVEITDLESYKELVQKEYIFKKVYEDREIYVVEGEEVEAGKG